MKLGLAIFGAGFARDPFQGRSQKSLLPYITSYISRLRVAHKASLHTVQPLDIALALGRDQE